MAVLPCSYKYCINSPRRNGLPSIDSLSCPYLTSSTAVVGDCQRNHSVPFWLITVLIFLSSPSPSSAKKKKSNKTPNQIIHLTNCKTISEVCKEKVVIPWQKYSGLEYQGLSRYLESAPHTRFWPPLVLYSSLLSTENTQQSFLQQDKSDTFWNCILITYWK